LNFQFIGATLYPNQSQVVSMEVDRRFFEALMRDKGLSLRALARRMNLGHSQLSLTFSGDRRLQLDESVQLSSIFGVPLSRIIQAMGLSAPTAGDMRVTVIGRVGGDGTVTLSEPGSVDRTTAPAGVPEDGIAVQFGTADTAMGWLDATVMFCAKPDGVPPSALGRLCLVQVKDGPMAVAAVRRGYQDGSFNLFGLHHRENVSLAWASPVLISRH
jgi:transcriptional regulator with XRE-family HTH domain